MLTPVIAELTQQLGDGLQIYVQDDAEFFSAAAQAIDDSNLEYSYRASIEIVPTLIKFGADQTEQDRI